MSKSKHNKPPRSPSSSSSLSDLFKKSATIQQKHKPDSKQHNASPSSSSSSSPSSSSPSSLKKPATIQEKHKPDTKQHNVTTSPSPPSLSDRSKKTADIQEKVKPDSTKHNVSASPVSPLNAGTTPTTTTSSTTSSGSNPRRVSFNIPSPKTAAEGSSSTQTNSSNKSTKSVKSPTQPKMIPFGNICPSGNYKTGMHTQPPSPRSNVLGSGTGHYGYGSIMRGVTSLGSKTQILESVDAVEVTRVGNEMYKKGNFEDALKVYDRAISLMPGDASYRINRAAALTALGRLSEAVRDCEQAVNLEPGYLLAHQQLGSLFIRLGMADIARKHICIPGQQPDPVELKKLQDVELHLKKCTEARRAYGWSRVVRECDATIAAGADSSPELYACRAEALLKLLRLDDAERTVSNFPRVGSCTTSMSQSKLFNMLSEAYVHYVRAQVEMSSGRFDNAANFAEKAKQIDPRCREIAQLVIDVKLVTGARNRGNNLFKSERYTEACTAYGEGLRHDPSNPILYCNRAACWFKIGQWQRSIDDCNQALRMQPSYTKALLRRAASNSKLEKWSDAVGDYEALRKIYPNDNEIAKSLFHCQAALRNFRGEELHNMKFGGEVEEVTSLEQFRACVSSPGVTIVYFKTKTNQECTKIWPYVDSLCRRHPLVSFIKVDIEESPGVSFAENVRIVPTFKIYKKTNLLKEMICPTHQVLECTVGHYSS